MIRIPEQRRGAVRLVPFGVHHLDAEGGAGRAWEVRQVLPATRVVRLPQKPYDTEVISILRRIGVLPANVPGDLFTVRRGQDYVDLIDNRVGLCNKPLVRLSREA